MLWGSSGFDTWTTFIPIMGERAPGYQPSPDHFQRVKRMLSPNWAQKMLCIIVPNRLRAIPEFSSLAEQHISIRNLWEVTPPAPDPRSKPLLQSQQLENTKFPICNFIFQITIG